MTSVHSPYCSLLRKALGFSTSDMLTGSTLNAEDVNLLIRLAQIQGTAPLVYDQLLKADSPLPDEAQMQLKQACMQNMMGYERKSILLKKVLSALKVQQLHPVILKGFGLAQLYPLPYLRSWGDLDIIVPNDEFDAACQVMRTLDKNIKIITEAEDTCKHQVAHVDSEVIELHQRGLAFRSYKETKHYTYLEKKALLNSQTITVDDITFAIPERSFNIFFVFGHAMEHMRHSGMPMKQLCDLCIIAHDNYQNMCANPSQWQQYVDYLQRNLNMFHYLRLWRLIGYIIVLHLGLPSKEWPLYKDNASIRSAANRLFQQIITEGQTRDNGPAHWQEGYIPSKTYLGRKWRTLSKEYFPAWRVMWPYSHAYAIHLAYTDICYAFKKTLKGQ